MSDYGRGVYILQQFARVAGQDKAKVVASYLARYGADSVTDLGKLGASVSFSALDIQFRELASRVDVSKADLFTSLINVGAQPPSISKAIVEGVTDSAVQAAAFTSSALKWIAIAAVVIGVVYAATQLGALKRAVGR